MKNPLRKSKNRSRFVYLAGMSIVGAVMISDFGWKVGLISFVSMICLSVALGQVIYGWTERGEENEWGLIDTLDDLKQLKVGDDIKYSLHIDKEPYEKGKITQIDAHNKEDRREFWGTPLRLYLSRGIFGDLDILLLNCKTGYDIPQKDGYYKLYLYKKTD